MKTKTTLNKILDFFPLTITRLISLILFQFLKKLTPIPYRITFILVLVFSTSHSFGQFGSCSAAIKAEDDRNIRSTPPDGTYYSMAITNTGTATETYSLNSTNVNGSCSNPDGTSNVSNVNLASVFANTNLSPINEISLSPGQTIKFLVNIKVPIGTSANKWSCIQIAAVSNTCPSYNVTTILHTLVRDPNEE